ncbi:MAG: efflux transporter outer membrane subunit [Betaproteobacteria bacterium]
MSKLVSVLASAAVFLAGCTLIPEYTRPEPPVPSQWPAGTAYREPPATPEAPLAADLEWREYFPDKRLQALIETGLRNNRNLRSAALNVERARALYRVQQTELLPAVDATGQMIRERVPGTLNVDDRSHTLKRYRAEVGVASWDIDFFGRIRSLTQAALEQYFATEQARRSAQILLIAEIANAYLTLAADRDSLALSKSTFETQQAAYDLIRRRFETGVVSELDLRQSQTRVDSARVDVVRFTEQLARDENALNLLVGSPVAPELLPEGLPAVSPPPALSPGVPSYVLLHRPDVMQAESVLKAANANIGAARAAFFPDITLTGAVGTASGDLSNLFKHGSLAWNFAPQITMPIFDARTWAALKVSEVEKELAVSQYEGAIQAAFRDVANALARYGTIDGQVQAQQSLVDATAATYRMSTARYDQGIDIYLNVLDAQRSLYAAQLNLIATHLIKLSNQVDLYAALGGGGGS